jgi:hypothetical protein
VTKRKAKRLKRIVRREERTEAGKMDTEGRHWAESYKPSEDIKETIPAGSRYVAVKSFAQFYDQIRRYLEAELVKEKKEFDILNKENPGLEIKGDKLIVSDTCDLGKIKRMKILAVEIWKMRESLDILKNLERFEENDAHKIGLAELSELLKESEPMLAMTISGKRD